MQENPDWKTVDSALRRLAADQCARDFEIGEWLIAAETSEPWEPFGYRSLYEYAERLFGWGYVAACERLRVAKALRELPGFADELRSGRLTFSVVREATRVATPETEAEWIAAVQGKTARVVEAKVARHVRGERPSDPGDPKRVRMRMVLEFTSQEWALVSRRFTEMRKGDPSLTDEELFCMLAQVEPGDGASAGAGEAPAFRIEMRVEPDGTAFMEGVEGEHVEVSSDAVEVAMCDAEMWEHATGGRLKIVKRQTVPMATQRELLALAKGKCEVCGVRIKPQKHHLRLVSEGGGNGIKNLILLCSSHHSRVHEGTLIIEGARATGWIFRHADGSLYGGVREAAPSAERVEANQAAFLALRLRGYPEAEIREVLEELRVGSESLSIAELVEAALSCFRARNLVPVSEPTSYAREGESRYGSFPRGQLGRNFHVGTRPGLRPLHATGQSISVSAFSMPTTLGSLRYASRGGPANRRCSRWT